MFKFCNQATVILVRISPFPIYARFPYPLHVVWNKYHYRQHYILFGDDTRPPCSPWVNSVPNHVRPEVFHDVSLMYDRCFSGICLVYDKCSSGICLMYEPIRTKSGVFGKRVEQSSLTAMVWTTLSKRSWLNVLFCRLVAIHFRTNPYILFGRVSFALSWCHTSHFCQW